jgi:hypothetical protein
MKFWFNKISTQILNKNSKAWQNFFYLIYAKIVKVLQYKFQKDIVGQNVWNKLRCYWEHVEKDIGNLRGTCYEPIGNVMGKCYKFAIKRPCTN